MIIVLADDFSGAAEIGGIAGGYGLSVEILLKQDILTDADLLVIDSNTRSLTEVEAVRIVSLLSRQIMHQAAEWLFIKIDSVLRGHITAELQAISAILNRKGVLIAPANPSQGRILTAGTYTIDGIPLNRTALAADPDFPRRSAKIRELLAGVPCIEKSADQPVNELIPRGLCVAESAGLDDLRYWAHHLTADTLPAGAADFFRAILETKGFRKQQESIKSAYRAGHKRLIILGSQASARQWQSEESGYRNQCECSLDLPLTGDQDTIKKSTRLWIDQILNVLGKGRQAVAFVRPYPLRKWISPRTMIKIFSQMAVTVIKSVKIEELIIEGGSTASHILRALHWERFQPVRELAKGVVVLKIIDRPDIQLIVKPGSYRWPEQLFLEK